jgi:hypothetical protein
LIGKILQVELFLETFLEYAKKPGAHSSNLGDVDPDYPHFSGFVFKVNYLVSPFYLQSKNWVENADSVYAGIRVKV